MITFKQGNIFQQNVQALVNPVNCVGVMGAGLALQFRRVFPENFKAYKAACQRGDVRTGGMFVFCAEHSYNPKFIINFPTKDHWRDVSMLRDIDFGLAALGSTIRKYHIRSIAIPPVGCGLGGLDWEVVCPRIEAAMAPFDDVHVIILHGLPAGYGRSHVRS